MRRPVSVKDVFSFCFLFPSCGFLRIRAGPPLSLSFHPHSWLSDFRSVHGGRSPYSRCCYLIIDLGSRLSTEAGPGVRRSHLISAVERTLYISGNLGITLELMQARWRIQELTYSSRET